ncbi:reverse transcriptase, RNA-dependent DNA polymerase, LTR copia-type gag-polypeptide [Tanacetum coccineum]
MRTLGCLAYAYHHTTDKFDSRATPTILIGYPNNQKGYLLYDPKTHKTITSRNVLFDETKFPFQTKHTPPTNLSPSLIPPQPFPYYPTPLQTLPTPILNTPTTSEPTSIPNSPTISNTNPSPTSSPILTPSPKMSTTDEPPTEPVSTSSPHSKSPPPPPLEPPQEVNKFLPNSKIFTINFPNLSFITFSLQNFTIQTILIIQIFVPHPDTS